MMTSSSALSDIGTPLVRDAEYLRRCRLMREYAHERVSRLRMRMCLYLIGCFIGGYLVGVLPSLCALLLCLSGDFLDCYILRYPVRRLLSVRRLQCAQILANITSLIQGLFLVSSVGLYYCLANSDTVILFVIAALGVGAVNAAIVSPKNPFVGLSKLALYAGAPFVFMSIDAYHKQSWEPFLLHDPSSVMLLFCFGYMFVAFTKSGFKNFHITEDMERQRLKMQAVTTRLEEQQVEMRQLSLVARNANDNVIISDKERRVLWVNEAFSQTTGFSLKEAQGQLIVDLLTGGEEELRHYEPIDQAVAQGHPFRGELENVTKDGRHIWVDVNLFPVRDDNGDVEFFISIERDVTEARRLAVEMAEAREAAEEGARAKAAFLANMSHEIRTPLTGVIGMADLLLETALDAEQSRYSESIRGASVSLMAIVNDILDLTKLDAGHMELDPVVFSPSACLQETIDLLSPAARTKNLEMTFEADASTPEFVKADDGRMRQVVTNILGNAIKFTDEGGVHIRLRALEDAQGARLLCEIQDTGIGIAPDQQELIFDQFTQAEAGTTRKFGGTGLGLSITRHILEVMGGAIRVQSEMGAGALFSIEIPYEAVGSTPVSIGAAANLDTVPDLAPGLRILVAEDNKTNRFLLKKYLKDQPVELVFAHDGVEAVEQTARFVPHLIFMDMSMPRMNGVQATREIRKMAVVQPTIAALTAHAFDGEMQACLDAGMDAFLTKPLRKLTLLNWIAAFQKRQSVEGAA